MLSRNNIVSLKEEDGTLIRDFNRMILHVLQQNDIRIPSRIKERVPRTEVAVYADDTQMLN